MRVGGGCWRNCRNAVTSASMLPQPAQDTLMSCYVIRQLSYPVVCCSVHLWNLAQNRVTASWQRRQVKPPPTDVFPYPHDKVQLAVTPRLPRPKRVRLVRPICLARLASSICGSREELIKKQRAENGVACPREGELCRPPDRRGMSGSQQLTLSRG